MSARWKIIFSRKLRLDTSACDLRFRHTRVSEEWKENSISGIYRGLNNSGGRVQGETP